MAGRGNPLAHSETITELRAFFRLPFSLQLDRRGEAGRGSLAEPFFQHRWDAPRSEGIGSQAPDALSIAPYGWRWGCDSRSVKEHSLRGKALQYAKMNQNKGKRDLSGFAFIRH